jgi:hypothetical protein
MNNKTKTTLRHTIQSLAAGALVVTGLLTSHPVFAAHPASHTRATLVYCNAWPEPLTFAGGKPTACRDARFEDHAPASLRNADGTLRVYDAPLSVYAACAQPSYGNMMFCPLWH